MQPADDDRPGRFFTWAELSTTSTGLPNVPTPEARENLRRLTRDVLDPLRAVLGPLRVTSGYRSPAVNAAIDGSATSDHPTGRAVDIVVDGMSSEEVARAVLDAGLPFDQLIWYAADRGGHVHIGHRGADSNRRQLLHGLPSSGFERREPSSRRFA